MSPLMPQRSKKFSFQFSFTASRGIEKSTRMPLNVLKQKQEKAEREKKKERESVMSDKSFGARRPESDVGGCKEREQKS